ncbi:ceramide phosphoethanolamine synthase-like [Copidosoma floridanum]|uniref:ceramide phosphoethanolamine synthase-like n=1 Tax=Copidosoma floridanum TaxID=29053 RepID=UPI0006C98980|nr:ceramide phosphoethanolamine synthase-like [Copidosoma floridanum]
MIVPPHATRVLLILTVTFVFYLLVMDYILYSRMQNYSIRPIKSEKNYDGKLACDIDPFCVVTVKALVLDYPNLYILSPLAAVVDHVLHISKSWTLITPNAISGFHVLVAVLAGYFVSSRSLCERRIGVILFEFRTWLDDLDGHVARMRKHITGERSDVGSAGYWVDGICDGLGCIALMVGVYFFVTKNPIRRSYDKLPKILPGLESQDISAEIINKNMRKRFAWSKVLLISGHLMIASVGWNRYISLYQNVLEADNTLLGIPKDELYIRQSEIMRSGFFWVVAVAWRLINFHSTMDYLLIAIFLDRLWVYSKLLKWFGYIVPLVVIYITEFHYLQTYAYVMRGSTEFAVTQETRNITALPNF